MKGEPDFSKCGGLLPAVIQDAMSGQVLMLGYMNEESFKRTVATQKVTFFSRSREELWTKGETSGNYLRLIDISVDCDRDALLVRAVPSGPTCHEGTTSCFSDARPTSWSILGELERVIKQRRESMSDDSYTASLFKGGVDRLAQKVGEEAIEVVIEAKNGHRERLLSESADLVFHLMALWESQGVSLAEVCDVLRERSLG
ncbi:MAG: phosphoribosyl-AMP cyclohydrolase/phosphoribosyl-ATP pyrophosphatase [Pseudomonadota bacterium]|jgi:phosphoribosyl-ATP pyrophosphohydrolase/phosphoribosyl-AMP cyclohydrolase